MKKPKINIVTLGCSKNKVDSERLAASLSHCYDIMHDSDKKSDVVIINTCGFIGDAKEESIDTILEYAELRKTNKIKKLYVMGCLSQRYRKDLQEEIHEVDGFFGVESVSLIAEDILKTERLKDVETQRLGDSVTLKYNHERVLSTPSHYAYLKISEGCNRRCAFCAIPLIRGEHVSVPMEDLIKEAELLAKKGVKELIQAFKRLKDYPHIKLMIIGGSFFGNEQGHDPFIQSLQEEAKELSNRIIFTGYVPYEQIPSYLKMADVAAVPSIWDDPFPTTILEAMAAGLPIVATHSGGIKESCGQCAIIVEKSSVIEGLHTSLLNLYNNPVKSFMCT